MRSLVIVCVALWVAAVAAQAPKTPTEMETDRVGPLCA
jgi:hypothetical protein